MYAQERRPNCAFDPRPVLAWATYPCESVDPHATRFELLASGLVKTGRVECESKNGISRPLDKELNRSGYVVDGVAIGAVQDLDHLMTNPPDASFSCLDPVDNIRLRPLTAEAHPRFRGVTRSSVNDLSYAFLFPFDDPFAKPRGLELSSRIPTHGRSSRSRDSPCGRDLLHSVDLPSMKVG